MKTYLARLALIGLTFCGAVLALNGSALAQNGPLRIEIDQQDTIARKRKSGAQIDGCGCFAHPTFLIGDRDDA